jgi:molecular chaperone GrpE (heat shock protein)
MNTKQDSWSTSASKASTQHNRENEQLRNKIIELENESDMLRGKLLAYQAIEINQLRERLQPEMKIAV